MSDYENVTCIISNPEELVGSFELITQEKVIKILPEPLAYYIQSLKMRFNSPYIGRFNEIILRASESGILSKLMDDDKMEQHSVPSAPEEISKEKLLPLLYYIMAIGYTFALVAFIAEIRSSISWSKFRQFCSSRLIDPSGQCVRLKAYTLPPQCS